MIIGAQLFSVRDKAGTREGLRETFRTMKEIGYQSVQLSGFQYDPLQARDLSQEFGLSIGLTHSSFDDITNRTDELIKRHKLMGCGYIGLGCMPPEYCDENNLMLVDKFIEDMTPATDKIFAAGLKFGYHNHHMEFTDRGGYYDMDVMFEKTNWSFVLDTGWCAYAGVDPVAQIAKFADRLERVHLKDFRKPLTADEASGNLIVPLGEGYVNIPAIVDALRKAGTAGAYVEQDNAVEKDSFDEMRKSFEYLKKAGLV